MTQIIMNTEERKTIALLHERINGLVSELGHLNGRVSSLERTQDLALYGKETVSESNADGEDPILIRLTTKQHVCLQMLLVGKSNEDIANRFGVTVNTAKVHVRAIARKYGVNTRSQVVMRAWKEFEKFPPAAYQAASGGLPKDWATLWAGGPLEADPFRKHYENNK